MNSPSPELSRELGPSSPFAGVVLAGGASRRMGRDKALLKHPEGAWGAEGTWLERSVARLAEAGARPIWVAGGDPSWVPEGAHHVPDGRPGQGPLAGIESAMQRSRAEGGAREGLPGGVTWCLVLACDLPRLKGESLSRLLRARSAAVSAVVARGPGGLEPLVALYQDALLEELADFLDSGQRSARRFLEGLSDGLQEVELPAAVLLNANTPQDLEGL